MWQSDRTCPSLLYLGFRDDDFMIGTRLSEILIGKEDQSFAAFLRSAGGKV